MLYNYISIKSISNKEVVEMPSCLCKVPGCSNDSKWKGLCVKHYTQMRRHGRILDKTRFDKNDVVVHQDYAEIILVDSTDTECGRA